MSSIKIIKIFLASSSELKDNREQFEIFINRKNKEYIRDNIFLELVIWEDFLDAMSATRLQDEYNKAITNCDIFVSLFKTKVGQYTEEEFTQAFKTFKINNRPLIYTYFQDSKININQINLEELTSFQNFKDKLSKLGHFYTIYENIDELMYRFSEQLSKLEDSLLKPPISDSSQLEKLENLQQKLTTQERSQQQQLKQLEVTYQQAKEKLEQQLEQEKLRFSEQQTNLQTVEQKIIEQESIIAQLQEEIKLLKSAPQTSNKQEVELKSEKGINYNRLRDFLQQKHWRESDEETSNLMLQAVNRERAGWLRQEDIDNFPSEDLRTINQLWLHYSDGKFGFSVQKEIYQSLGGTREYDSEVWIAFCDRLGWRKSGEWLDWDELTYENTAPKAHLPSLSMDVLINDEEIDELENNFGFILRILLWRTEL